MSIRVAIVGGGIIGCMIARELRARAPTSSITVIERDGLGFGATRRSAGLHIPRWRNARLRLMTTRSHGYYRALLAEDPSLPIHPIPITLVAAENREQELRARYLDVTRLLSTELPPRPAIRLSAGVAAWRVNGGHHADAGVLTRQIADALRPHMWFREGNRVVYITPTDEDIVVGLGTGDSIHVDRLVLAPGPWLNDPAWGRLVLPLDLRVKKIVALHLEQRPPDGAGVYFFHDDDAFLLPLHGHGYWLFSHRCQEWDVEPDQLTNGLSNRNVEEAFACLRPWAPELCDVPVSGRVFCDAYATDGPVIKPLTGDGRILFAGAAGGYGYRLAPAIAMETVDHLCPPMPRSGE